MKIEMKNVFISDTLVAAQLLASKKEQDQDQDLKDERKKCEKQIRKQN